MSDRQDNAAEVESGRRFQFGKNWQHFLLVINDERVTLAENSLRKLLGQTRFDGRSFLDVGSGSGLFSLAARRLGARVHSFDYDPQSVACTKELRRRYFGHDANWTIEEASVLDRDFLGRLGEYDIVYSWGVLHHTGAMWSALENVKPLVRMGGQLYIAIYNDLGAITQRWHAIKRRYNALPPTLRMPFATAFIVVSESRTLLAHVRNRDLKGYVRTWTDYQKLSTRGMSRWHDWLDWIGGYPYEFASLEAIVDAFDKDGFRLTAIEDRSSGTGCNEFVFKREAPLGTPLAAPLPESRFFVRRFGRPLVPPPVWTEAGYAFSVPVRHYPGSELLLFKDNKFLGRGVSEADIVVVPVSKPCQPQVSAPYHLVEGYAREIPRPIQWQRGRMWSVSATDFRHLADKASDTKTKSPVFLFEDNQQLAFPHSMHDHIAKHGSGRFSHWGDLIYFSTSDNSNPNTNGRIYRLLYPAPAA
jgi:2-polyprenyl-6-hydroxyphenyl methylase/3-demethylubiquinone-9 3-methyltransferase